MTSKLTAPTILLGLSGPSSSGKTTIARLIRDIFPSTLIVHEDDYYRPEEELPMRAGLKDWDCAGAIDLPAFVSALRYIRQHGTLPQDFDSKEDQNEIGDHGLSEEIIQRHRNRVQQWAESRNEVSGKTTGSKNCTPRIIIVDGFLLFSDSVKVVREELDVKILLRAKYKDAKMRREARAGYVTLEGFWKDPPGYFDSVVWPSYVEEHGFLFKNGNVDGEVNEERAQQLGISGCPEGTWKIESILSWVIGEIMEFLRA